VPTIPEPWKKHRTFASLARAECCNCRSGGACIQRRAAPALPGPFEVTSRRQFEAVVKGTKPANGGLGRCVLLLKEPSRCAWFERCLLPAAPPAVVEEYHATFPDCRFALEQSLRLGGKMSEKPCPDCGSPKAKGKQYCDACREERKRESRNRRQNKWRRGA